MSNIIKFEKHYGILARYFSKDCNIFKAKKKLNQPEIKYIFCKDTTQNKSITLHKDKLIKLCENNGIEVNESTRLQISPTGEFEIALGKSNPVSSCKLENVNREIQAVLVMLDRLTKHRQIANNVSKEGLLITNESEHKSNTFKEQTDYSFPGEIHKSEEQRYFEGVKKEIIVNKFERDPRARNERLKNHDYSCEVCGFNFKKIYGTLGVKFIHVHHLIPLNEIGEEYEINPQTDLLPVCPNCHAMLHRMADPSDIQTLKNIINKNRNG